jgi:general secretion pathway protein K
MALFVVLWVLAILMITVFSFSRVTRTETHATLGFKDAAERKFLAEAGIERGIIELLYRKQNIANPVTLEGSEIWKADGTVYNGQLGDGFYTVSILGDAGKLDINKASDVLLKNLLLNAGVKEDAADTIVDSVMDWKDPSGLTRLHGAGTDYYMSLPIPYNVKGGNFDTLEELLLVKGVTPALLYGEGSQHGIIDFLTVNGLPSINLNYAPKEVLMAIPGMPSDTADNVIQFRKDQPIINAQEPLAGADYQLIAPFITAGEGNVFTIDAVGHKRNEKTGYPIRATVMIQSDNKWIYLYYKSPAYKAQ